MRTDPLYSYPSIRSSPKSRSLQSILTIVNKRQATQSLLMSLSKRILMAFRFSTKTFSTLICICIVLGMLVVGLSPFRGPANEVKWLSQQRGVHIGRYGTILSHGSFPSQVSESNEDGCSLEIWLQPDSVKRSSAIASFSASESPEQLSLVQYFRMLLLTKESSKDGKNSLIGVQDVFSAGKPTFVTITSGQSRSAIYVDGLLKMPFPQFRFSENCNGQLILGTSPVAVHQWQGQLYGLAVYDTELSTVQVLQHYKSWTKSGLPALRSEEFTVAQYRFDELHGNVIHNVVPHGIDLFIPTRYVLAHQIFLQPFWTEYVPGWSTWQDILINIIGFIPLGIVFRNHWTRIRPARSPILATMLLGLGVSLAIEVVQHYIPTRSSGTMDLITNTAGTYIGVLLYATRKIRGVLEKAMEFAHPGGHPNGSAMGELELVLKADSSVKPGEIQAFRPEP